MYPAYTNPQTAEWWIQTCMEFKNILDYDGIWIVSLNLLFKHFSPGEKGKCSLTSLFTLYSKLKKVIFFSSWFLMVSALTALMCHSRGELLPVTEATSYLLTLSVLYLPLEEAGLCIHHCLHLLRAGHWGATVGEIG